MIKKHSYLCIAIELADLCSKELSLVDLYPNKDLFRMPGKDTSKEFLINVLVAIRKQIAIVDFDEALKEAIRIEP